MNGIVTITKVTNSLSVANNNEYNQVLQPDAGDSQSIIFSTDHFPHIPVVKVNQNNCRMENCITIMVSTTAMVLLFTTEGERTR